MMVQKIVVLIEDQVKLRVAEEVHDQLTKMLISRKIIHRSSLDSNTYGI